jgi:hypothetical protein
MARAILPCETAQRRGTVQQGGIGAPDSRTGDKGAATVLRLNLPS